MLVGSLIMNLVESNDIMDNDVITLICFHIVSYLEVLVKDDFTNLVS